MYTFSISMSLLSALLTPALNHSHPSSYHLSLLLTFSAILIAITPEDQLGKDLFDWLLSSDLLPLKNHNHHTLLHRATGNRSSLDLSLVSAPMASKRTWQILPNLGSDHLHISITIPTSPLINSISCSPSFNYNKARWDEYFFYIDTHCPPPSSFLFFLSEATHTLPNSSMMLPLLPFLSATSIALLKPGGLPKLQTPLRNAKRHSQRCLQFSILSYPRIL